MRSAHVSVPPRAHRTRPRWPSRESQAGWPMGARARSGSQRLRLAAAMPCGEKRSSARPRTAGARPRLRGCFLAFVRCEVGTGAGGGRAGPAF